MVVYSTPLNDVETNVALIRRRVALAGAVAVAFAVLAGFFVARALSRRIKRLEQAAEKVAAGDFSQSIPPDSDDELGQLAKAFNDMQRQLAQLDTARKRFIATASHELRTPIFSLAGFVELLQDEELEEEERQQFLGQIREQTDRLQKLASELLDLSTLEAGSLELRPEPTDVGDLARTVATEFTPALTQHDSHLELRLSRSPITAECDPERVAQIMRILIDNALAHTPRGTDVFVSATRANGALRVAVRDHGPGIRREMLPRIFEPFVTTDDAQGSGLGLAIARELAERMDGRLGVDSMPGSDGLHRRAAGVTRGSRRHWSRRRCCALAGCGGSSTSSAPSASSTGAASTATSRVEVLKALPGGRFDPQAIYRRSAPGVVTVISEFAGGSANPLAPQGAQAGLGSGFVVSAAGEIATNAHVVTSGEGASIRRARHVYVQFSDDNQVPATIVGADPNSDVGLIRVNPAGLTLRPLPLGSSAGLVVGAPVAAIGSPFGEPESLSVGVVSGLDRTIDSLTNFQIAGAIQTDAAINRGNSGGPLVNAQGQVIGINSQIQSTGGGGEGVGFAVPIDTVKHSLAELRRHGKVAYAYLGVSTVAVFPQLARRIGLPVDHGALVQDLTSGGPAASAGIRAGDRTLRFQARQYSIGGDLIVKAGGRTLSGGQDDLGRAIAGYRPGQEVELELYRDGQRRTVRVKLGERPLTRPQLAP